MALAKRKNGVPLINKAKASGVPITSLGQKFVDLDFEFMQFEISTVQGGSTDLHSSWFGTGFVAECADVSWGDGSFEAVPCTSGVGLNNLHSYASDGNYSIRYYSLSPSLVSAFRNVQVRRVLQLSSPTLQVGDGPLGTQNFPINFQATM